MYTYVCIYDREREREVDIYVERWKQKDREKYERKAKKTDRIRNTKQ